MDADLLAGRYRLRERVGSGGAGAVFLADDTRLGRRVAVKRLHTTDAEEALRRFEREARIGASLSSPDVVQVYDALFDSGDVFIVMEYVDGATLSQWVDGRPRDPAEALPVLRTVAAALDHLHRAGIVHRDVKPSNVLIRRDGRVKLADLGIAAATDASRITSTGVVLGSPPYIAPERFAGEEATAASDVYSFAAVAYEVLAGRRARHGTPLQIAREVTGDGGAPDLRDALPGAPPAAAEALARAMDPDPARRPSSCTALVDALAAAYAAPAAPPTAPPPATTPPAARPPRRRRRALAAVGVLVLAAAAVVAGLLSTGGGPGRAPRPGTPAGPAGPSAAASVPAAAGGAAGGGVAASPRAAVTGFYRRAAAHNWAGAWALAGPGFRDQLGGYDGMKATLDTLRSIEFLRTDVTSSTGGVATVAIRTVAHHTDRTDHCSGTVTAVRAGGGWVVGHIDVSC